MSDHQHQHSGNLFDDPAHKRMHLWEQMHAENKINNMVTEIPGYSKSDPSTSFLLTIQGLQGVRLPKQIQNKAHDEMKLTCEYHLTFFYRNMTENQMFFFGRSTRSRKFELIKQKDGTYGTDQTEPLYFHSSLKKDGLQDRIQLCCEVVLTMEDKNKLSRKGSKPPEIPLYFSGGYGTDQIFSNLGRTGEEKPTIIHLLKGSPRDLTALIVAKDGSNLRMENEPYVSYTIRKYPSFDKLQNLLPSNNLVHSQSIIPGLVSEKFPFPKISSKDKPQDLIIVKPSALYIHNCEVQGSVHTEATLERILARMWSEKKMNKQGKKMDPKDINVFIESRTVNVKVHNTWKQISNTATCSLREPDNHGIFHSDAPVITFRDFVPSPLCALLFELEFKASIQGIQQKTMKLGFGLVMPELNSVLQIKDTDIELQLIKGPGLTYDNELLFSEQASFGGVNDNVFDFVVRAQLSTSQTAPKREHKNRQASEMGLGVKPGLPGNHIPSQQEKDAWQNRQPHNPYDPKQNPHLQPPPGPIQRDPYAQPPSYNNRDNYIKQNQPYPQRQVDPNPQPRFDQQYDRQGMTREQEDMMRLLELQKTQLNQESEQMRNYMKDFMDKMIDMQNIIQQQKNVHQVPEYDRKNQGYGPQNQMEMQQIGNVFYNLLNMVGSQQRDERIIGLSNELRQQIQSKRFDQLFDQNVPYAGFDKINLLRVTDLSNHDQARLMSNGMGDLLHHPTAQMLSSSIQKEKINMDLEETDPLKASQIKVKFISYKTPNGGLDKIPEKLYFQMRFFTFQPIVTENMRMQTDRDQAGRPFLQPSTPYFLIKSSSRRGHDQPGSVNENNIEVTFDIDPSESKIINEHIKLAEYLKERFLTIDIFDVKTKFFFGSCKIPLFELMRQGKKQIVRAKECEIFNPENSQYNGYLHVILSNEGKTPSVQDMILQNQSVKQEGKIGKQPSQGRENRHNKKKELSKPMDLHSIQAARGFGQSMQEKNDHMISTGTYKSNDYNKTIVNELSSLQLQASVEDPNLRKKLRVDRIRKMTMGKTIGNETSIIADPSQPDWAKYKQIQEIEMIRQTKKNQVIKSVMGSYLSDSIQVPVIPGDIYFMTIPIENKTNERQTFKFTIHDPDSELLEESEVQMVHQMHENQHWEKLGKQKRQKYDYITSVDTVLLPPGERMEVLFKFQTTRDVSHSHLVQASCDIIKQRNIKISVMSNMTIVSQYDCNMMPVYPPIDHVFRFYEPEHSYFKVTIPPFLQFNHPNLHIKCSRSTAQAIIDERTQSIYVQSKTGAALDVVDLTVFIWSDTLRGNCLASIKIEVTPLSCLYSQTKAGVQNSLSIALPAKNARSVELYMSKPKNVYLPQRSIMNKFNVIPNSINHIQVHTKTYNAQQERVVVNAIDSDSDRLLYSWLLILASEAPTPSRTESVPASVYNKTVAKIKFTNTVRKKLLFEISSSNESIMQPMESLIEFDGLQTSYIELMILPQATIGTAPDIFLYIGDLDQHVVECIRLQIMYTQ